MIAPVFLLLWSTGLLSVPMANMQTCQAAINQLHQASWISLYTSNYAICIETGLKP